MRSPERPPSGQFDLSTIDLEGLMAAAPTLPDGRYLHWNDLRHRQPPAGKTVNEWWLEMRFARARMSVDVAAMTDVYERRFQWSRLPSIDRQLHEFDRANVGARILSALGNSDAQTEYRVRQLIEEAISSSEIEGARPTTRELARQMLRQGREPTSHSDRMIVNNLRAMERLREMHEARTLLGISELLELHRILGDGALEVEGAGGQFRGPQHDVTVSDQDGTTWHRPPAADGIEQRVAALLDFANGDAEPSNDELFVHPILRAIITHFWLGYEHPFRDGNGRIARALFYWCLLRHGYEVAEFLSISGPIERAPKAYYLAFAHAETDNNDLTYFILHQLDVMQTALTDLLTHLTKRAQRMRALSSVIATFDSLNHRQRSLLEHAIRHPHEGQTVAGHQHSHRVHYMTAREDLAKLEQRQLLTSRKFGTTKFYYPSPSLLQQSGPLTGSER